MMGGGGIFKLKRIGTEPILGVEMQGNENKVIRVWKNKSSKED